MTKKDCIKWLKKNEVEDSRYKGLNEAELNDLVELIKSEKAHDILDGGESDAPTGDDDETEAVTSDETEAGESEETEAGDSDETEAGSAGEGDLVDDSGDSENLDEEEFEEFESGLRKVKAKVGFKQKCFLRASISGQPYVSGEEFEVDEGQEFLLDEETYNHLNSYRVVELV